MTVPGSHHADFRGLLLGWTACPAIPDNLSGVSGPRWISQKTLLVLFPKIASHGLCFACFQAAARQFSCLQRIVMARRHCRRAVMLRVELGSTSSRTRLCFESNQALLLVEPRSASSRTTLWLACGMRVSATLPWHETVPPREPHLSTCFYLSQMTQILGWRDDDWPSHTLGD